MPVDAVRVRTVDDVVVVFLEPNREFDEGDERRWREALEAPNIRKTLVLTVGQVDSGGEHRRRITEVLLRNRIRFVAVTDNRINRGLVGLFGYLGVSVSAYSWGRLEDAARDVAARPELVAAIVRAARALRAESPAAVGLQPDEG